MPGVVLQFTARTIDKKSGNGGGGAGGDDSWIKRQAVQVVAQLPDNAFDALRVLTWAEAIVRALEDGGPTLA